MIVGTGIDIVEVPRIAKSIERFRERFLNRVFTTAEIAYCDSKVNRMERFAARFAAKEAAMKAIGTGMRGGVTWRDFEVGREPSGRPVMLLHGKAAQVAERLGARRTHLSVSHTEEHAVAYVVLEN
ncbi:MAG TPA: holo-[acyl-carrier-protein] synthase [Candidatus Koribacter sp.]|jgi:holo-[acyl-carrier protein] synthase